MTDTIIPFMTELRKRTAVLEETHVAQLESIRRHRLALIDAESEIEEIERAKQGGPMDGLIEALLPAIGERLGIDLATGGKAAPKKNGAAKKPA